MKTTNCPDGKCNGTVTTTTATATTKTTEPKKSEPPRTPATTKQVQCPRCKTRFGVTVLLLCAFGLLLGCTACQVAVPKTQLTGSIGGKPFSFVGPKDTTVASIDLASETNGALHVVVKDLNSRNNADVIGAAGSAYAAQVKAISDAFNSGVAAAAAAYGTAAGTAVKAAVAP